jgi:phytoene dehydrogenase-like protein
VKSISNNLNAIVVGSGIAGIASAIRLQQKGFNVTVYEKSLSGGKLSTFKLGNRFDAGPSLFTMPNFVDELFQLAGKILEIILNISSTIIHVIILG